MPDPQKEQPPEGERPGKVVGRLDPDDLDKVKELSHFIREPEPSIEPTQQAKKEEDLGYEKELEKEEKTRKHSRQQQSKDWIHKVILINIAMIGVCIAFGIVFRALHLFIPRDNFWIHADELAALDQAGLFIATGAVGGVLTKYLGQHTDSI